MSAFHCSPLLLQIRLLSFLPPMRNLLADSCKASTSGSKQHWQEWWNWNWLLYYALSSRLQASGREIYIDLENFSVWLFFFLPFSLSSFLNSLSMQKQSETKRNKKWRSEAQLNTQHTDFLTFFLLRVVFRLFSPFDEMDDWHISRISGWVELLEEMEKLLNNKKKQRNSTEIATKEDVYGIIMQSI